METTTVHLLRHGEARNPEGVLYGRMPGFHLTELGREMAELAATALQGRDVVLVRSSPLERALETAQPLCAGLGLTVDTDPDLIEAENVFEGQGISIDNVLGHPQAWRHLANPLRPSWGEPYKVVASRMRRAIVRARGEASGRAAVLVSHQLPIWIARRDAEGRRLVHNPRKRQCTLASITSLRFEGDALVAVVYTEPSAHLMVR